jgi:pimeloyl-ACP methyl ester carboxylesterase
MPTAQTLTLADGRHLGYDDVGDPTGTPVLFVHGTPDSRRARHPDDGLAAAAGVRLIAVDRVGIGLSSPHAEATVGSFADDVLALADHLGIDRWRVLAWSGGAPYGLAVAARHPDRVDRVTVVAGLVPFEAYDTPGILDRADGGRWMVAELGRELGPSGLADEAVPMMVPFPCDEALARDHVTEGADPFRRKELDAVPGAVDVLALGVVDAAAGGEAGLRRDVELQVEAPDVDWSAVACPVDLVYGDRDGTTPVAFGEWWAERLRWPELTVVAGAGHLLALTGWADHLARVCTEAPDGAPA